MDINELLDLCSLKTYNSDRCMSNHFYGNSFYLKKYCCYNKFIEAKIEHGVYIGGHTPSHEWDNNGFPAVITYSRLRYDHLRKKTFKPIFTVGPYIHYADDEYTEAEIQTKKLEYGKTLVVFPTHSIKTVKYEYDIEEFISFINEFRIKHQFKSVIICMYYQDIINGSYKKYLNKGFDIVTAGNINNNQFLKRLKSIILLSDYTLSNNLGTHLGYCIYMGKPHMIFQQEISCIGKNYDLETEFNRGENYKECLEFESHEIIKEFNFYTEHITESQYNIVNKYWGIDQIKTKDEIKEIFQFCADASKTFTKTDASFKNRLKKISKNSRYYNIIDLYSK